MWYFLEAGAEIDPVARFTRCGERFRARARSFI